MLTTRELDSMRSTLDASLPGTAVISRYSGTSDGQGGSIHTWAPVGTVIARISPATGGGQGVSPVDGGRQTHEDEWVITFPDGTSVTERDRVSAAGAAYEITSVDTLRSWDLCVRVHAKRGLLP